MKISKTKRDINIYLRARKEREMIRLDPDALTKLNFYQLKQGTAAFFYDRLGRTSVRIADTAHFAFAQGLAQNDAKATAEGERYYRDYLRASWGDRPVAEFDKQVADFRLSVAHYKSKGFTEPPVLTRLPTESAPYVVDGNHRSAMAAALGQTIDGIVWPADLAFLKYTRVKGFYGTGNRDMPYQSITLAGQEVIPGRRNDLAKRLALVPPDVLQGRTILDVACNVGMSSILAVGLGAKSALGLEVSQGMVDLGARFAMFSGTYPTVTCRQFNLDADDLGDQVFDTAFMFSIHDHLKRPERLTEIAKRNVGRWVIFEAHPGGTSESYKGFLQSGLFASVRELGRLDISRNKQDGSRILWLCEKAV